MEKLKDPAMILSTVNTVGLVGVTAYFYKRLEAMQLDMMKITQTLSGVVKKLSEIEKGEQNRKEVQHALSNQINELNQLIQELPSTNDIENIDTDIEEIISNIEDQLQVTIDRPSPHQRHHNVGRRNSSQYSDEEDDRRSTSARRSTIRSNDRNRDDHRQSSRRSRDNNRNHGHLDQRQQRFNQSQEVKPENRMEARTEPRTEPANNDLDLIDEFRRNQQDSN